MSILTIITLILIISTLAILSVYFGYRISSGKSSLKWSYVTGDVIKSRLTKDYGGDGADTYNIRIKYSYKVNNKLYTSKKVSYKFLVMTGESEARKLYKSLINDKKVKVFYNPKKPRQSVIIQGYTIGLEIAVIIISLFMICIFSLNLQKLLYAY